MPFDAKRWSEPRKAIATGLNDLQYGIHGGLIAVEILKKLNEPWDVLAASTLLDFGCGTGRISRVLTKAFRKIDAYDPSSEAIDEGIRECPSYGKMTFNNLFLHKKLPDFIWDYSIAVNVFEHIPADEQNKEWENLLSRTRKKALIYAHSSFNSSMPFKYEKNGMHLFVVEGKAK